MEGVGEGVYLVEGRGVDGGGDLVGGCGVLVGCGGNLHRRNWKLV